MDERVRLGLTNLRAKQLVTLWRMPRVSRRSIASLVASVFLTAEVVLPLIDLDQYKSVVKCQLNLTLALQKLDFVHFFYRKFQYNHESLSQ